MMNRTLHACSMSFVGALAVGCFTSSGDGTAGTGSNGSGGGAGAGSAGTGGAGTGGVSGTGGTVATAMCARLAQESADAIAAVVDTADLSCAVDADCSLVSIDTACHAACGALAGPDGKTQIEAAVAREDQVRCASYETDGCVRLVPPCVPPASFHCGSGTCTWNEGGEPDGGSPMPDSGLPQDGCVDATVSWRFDGGFVAYTDNLALTPCRTFTLERKSFGDPGSDASCSNEVASDATITVGAVDAALADTDVQAAFAIAPVLFGRDSRPVDGTVFRIEVGGAVIEVGDACTDPTCTAIPAGVEALRGVLQQLAEQQRALPDCDALP